MPVDQEEVKQRFQIFWALVQETNSASPGANLSELDLSGLDLDEQGLENLLSGHKNARFFIRKVDLSNNPRLAGLPECFTDPRSKHGLTHLNMVDLSNTAVPESTIDLLRDANVGNINNTQQAKKKPVSKSEKTKAGQQQRSGLVFTAHATDMPQQTQAGNSGQGRVTQAQATAADRDWQSFMDTLLHKSPTDKVQTAARAPLTGHPTEMLDSSPARGYYPELHHSPEDLLREARNRFAAMRGMDGKINPHLSLKGLKLNDEQFGLLLSEHTWFTKFIKTIDLTSNQIQHLSPVIGRMRSLESVTISNNLLSPSEIKWLTDQNKWSVIDASSQPLLGQTPGQSQTPDLNFANIIVQPLVASLQPAVQFGERLLSDQAQDVDQVQLQARLSTLQNDYRQLKAELVTTTHKLAEMQMKQQGVLLDLAEAWVLEQTEMHAQTNAFVKGHEHIFEMGENLQRALHQNSTEVSACFSALQQEFSKIATHCGEEANTKTAVKNILTERCQQQKDLDQQIDALESMQYKIKLQIVSLTCEYGKTLLNLRKAAYNTERILPHIQDQRECTSQAAAGSQFANTNITAPGHSDELQGLTKVSIKNMGRKRRAEECNASPGKQSVRRGKSM